MKIKSKFDWGNILVFLPLVGIIGLICAGLMYVDDVRDKEEEVSRFQHLSSQGIAHGHADVFKDTITGQEIVCIEGRSYANRSCYLTGRIIK